MGSTSQNFTFPTQSPLSSSSSNNSNGFPMLAVALLGISATVFLLVGYYIFVNKCCFRFQQLDPFRRFSFRQAIRLNNSHRAETLSPYSPSWQSRGLDELLIRDLPTFQYSKNREAAEPGKIVSRCVVCLTEFQDYDVLRLLPKCNHAFHLDCIDVWLQNNNNCPLCRSTISGRNRYSEDRVIAPNSSPQDPYEMFLGSNGDGDFVAIELGRGEGSSRILMNPRSHSSRKFDFRFGKLCSKLRKHSRRVSIVGDEGIGMRGDDDDDRFLAHQPIRRSFSMDSVVDRGRIYTSVRDDLRHNIDLICERSMDNEESGISISRRMMSLFGQGGRGSRNVVCPVEF